MKCFEFMQICDILIILNVSIVVKMTHWCLYFPEMIKKYLLLLELNLHIKQYYEWTEIAKKLIWPNSIQEFL